jgi:alkylation response protein AidB-like acyl-CoA dehydrogenase
MRHLLENIVEYKNLEKSAELDDEMVEAILTEAAKLARDVLAPLNRTGDEFAMKCEDGVVKTPPGYKEAYKQYCESGWNSVPFSPDYDGQGLPWSIAFPLQEMWQASSISFGLCPLLTQGAVEAIESHGSQELKDIYLARLIAGEWTGTMNLTEPQAGSDLAAVRAKAIPNDDGSYALTGQKIYITYGEHDMAENIIHLVLARLPDAPEGVKGISLFIVPKFLVNEDGSLGARNDVICSSIEHKLGIHASPTCTMIFGENGGATGYLVGEAHQGLKYMFTMMNNARLCVGLQGIGVSERSYQAALHYAQDRKQGKDTQGQDTAIVNHSDVRRMLMTMRAYTEAARALAYEAGAHLDRGNEGNAASSARVGLLTPVVKAWSTDIALEVTSLGVQICGGMGFVEETGVAQYYRDARILPIYEGTNGIQSLDLVFRKILLNEGTAFKDWLADAREKTLAVSKCPAQSVTKMSGELNAAYDMLEDATMMLAKLAGDKQHDRIGGVAAVYLKLFGLVAGASMLARSLTGIHDQDGNNRKEFYEEKAKTTQFYFDFILPQIHGLMPTIQNGITPEI